MLSNLEKFQYCLNGFILLVVVAAFLVLRIPFSREYIPPLREASSTTIEEPGGPTSTGPTTRRAPSPEERAHLEKINELSRKHGLRRKRSYEKKEYNVPRRDFDYLSNAASWVPELNKAKHTVHRDASGRPTMCEIYDIEPGSYLEKLGLQDSDVIMLVDGGSMEFDSSQQSAYVRKAQDAFRRLTAGEPFSITVLRGGKPVHMVFQVPE